MLLDFRPDLWPEFLSRQPHIEDGEIGLGVLGEVFWARQRGRARAFSPTDDVLNGVHRVAAAPTADHADAEQA